MTTQQKTSHELFSFTGKGYFLVTFIGRLPLAMIVVGITTLVLHYTNSYAQAGLVSAIAGLSSAFSAPFVGKFSDSHGQQKILVPFALLQGILLLALVYFTSHHAHLNVIIALAFGAGFFSPQVAALVRARWLHIFKANDINPIREQKLISATLSYESMADETSFVLGPVLVGILASLIDPRAPLIIAAVLTFIFVLAFAFHHTKEYVKGTKAQVTEDEHLDTASLARAALIVPLLGMLCIGFFFGATLNSLAAFMGTKYNSSLTGIIYGAMGIGSAGFAFAIVFLPRSFSFANRWLSFTTIMFLASLPLALCNSIVPLVILLFIMGAGLGPTMVTLFSIGSQEAGNHQVSTVMTLFSSGIIIGQAIGAALVGLLAQKTSYNTAFLSVTATTTVLLVLAIIYKQFISNTSVALHH
ncbi:MAG: MFS transporter [Micrococcaceae bacterium]